MADSLLGKRLLTIWIKYSSSCCVNRQLRRDLEAVEREVERELELKIGFIAHPPSDFSDIDGAVALFYLYYDSS